MMTKHRGRTATDAEDGGHKKTLMIQSELSRLSKARTLRMLLAAIASSGSSRTLDASTIIS